MTREREKDLSEYAHRRTEAVNRLSTKKITQVAASALTIAGCLAMSLPSMAITAFNDYRVCAGRLLNLGITAEATANACSAALRPRDLSACVVQIEQQTEIAGEDALNPCAQARRPQDLANCVVGISRNAQEAANPEVLNYCRRSLLPVRFAQCVVGLRAETDFDPTQAMQACIDASYRPLGNFLPSFIPITSQDLVTPAPTLPDPTNPGGR